MPTLPLTQEDLNQIAEQIKQSYTSGIIDSEEAGRQVRITYEIATQKFYND